MWSLNEWCNCMLWLGVLKTEIAIKHECDFRVSIKFEDLNYANCLRNDMLNYLCFIRKVCVKGMIHEMNCILF
jgi:hypothetical protein